MKRVDYTTEQQIKLEPCIYSLIENKIITKSSKYLTLYTIDSQINQKQRVPPKMK